ncbi:hypothetical protein ABZV61_13120 [Streptomyces sp900116325]|uniref:Uncharacterized protein n=1 Tax=Streptomyces sp. 900116325 TaxID=3154295 RepID=A0ABV2U8E1_9ACTN
MKWFGGQCGIDAVCDVVGHALRSRQGAKEPTDLFERDQDLCTDAALVDVTAYFCRAGRRQQFFGEIGDLPDVRVLGRVGR